MDTTLLLTRVNEKLQQQIHSPEEATFLLSLFYKLIESTDEQRNYSAVVFYRNWCQHAVIDRPHKVTSSYIDHVGAKIKTMQEERKIKYKEYPGGIYDKFYFWREVATSIACFQDLKFNIQDLLEEHSIKHRMNEKWWFMFRSHLKIAVSEVPVKINLPRCPIEEITLIHAAFRPSDNLPEWPTRKHLFFYTKVRTSYSDETTVNTTVDLLPLGA